MNFFLPRLTFILSLFALAGSAVATSDQPSGKLVAAKYHSRLPEKQALKAKVDLYAALLDRFCTKEDLNHLWVAYRAPDLSVLTQRCRFILPQRQAESVFHELGEAVFLLSDHHQMDEALVLTLQAACSEQEANWLLGHAGKRLGFSGELMPLAHIEPACVATIPFLAAESQEQLGHSGDSVDIKDL